MADFVTFTRFRALNMLRIIWSLFLLLDISGVSFTIAQEGTVLKETCQVFTFQFQYRVEQNNLNPKTIEILQEPLIKKLKEFISEPQKCSKMKPVFHSINVKEISDPVFDLVAYVSFIFNPLDNITSSEERLATPIVCLEEVNEKMGFEQQRLIEFLPLDISGTIQSALVITSTKISCCKEFHGQMEPSCCRSDFIEYLEKCACPSGRFLDMNKTRCEHCPQDTYQPDNASIKCEPCPNGTTTYTSTGAPSVSACRKACSPGERFNLASKICNPCPKNTYQELRGQLGCVSCPNNTITNGTRNKRLNDCIQSCKPGRFFNLTSSSCESCPRNSYQQAAGQFNCIPCKQNRITLKSGSNNEQDCILECDQGSFYDFGTVNCRPCALNYYQNLLGQLNCTSCPDNKITINISSTTVQDCITNCSSGSAFNYTTQDCRKCPLNFFQSKSGQTECKRCPDGKITSSPGAQSTNSCFIECNQGSFYDFGTANCHPCPLNYYQNLLGQLNCTHCPDNKITINVSSLTVQDCITNCTAGSSFNYTTQNCQKCPRNFFQSKSGKTECIRCLNGKITNSPGARFSNSCFIACEPGQFYNFSSNRCEKCKINSYQQFRGQLKCIPCKHGMITVINGSKDPNDCIPECDAGMKYSAVDFQCVLCPRNTYKPTRGESECFTCPSEKITYKDNNTKESDCAEECKPGNYFNTTTWNCTKCRRNTTQIKKGETKCLPCPKDKNITEEEGTAKLENCIKLCPPGKYYNKSHLFECDPCAKDFYQPNAGTSKCLMCPGRSVTFEKGAKTVKDCVKACPPGTHHVNRTVQCAPCNMESYQDAFGQETCKLCKTDYKTFKTNSIKMEDCLPVCEVGEYLNNLTGACEPCAKNTYQPSRRQFGCIPCPNGTLTLNTSSTSVDLCIADCEKGFYYNHTLRTCVPCPLGTFKPLAGHDKCTLCSQGKTTQNNGSKEKIACFEECIEGAYYNSTLNVCVECSLGEYQPSAGQKRCLKCLPGQTTLKISSIKSDACIKDCEKGSYYNMTSRKCILCPMGEYQPSSGQVECLKCFSFLTTYQRGSDDVSACSLACNPGHYYNTTIENCETCPVNTYQDRSKATTCKPCPPNKVTTKRETKNLEECVLLESSKSPQISVVEAITIVIPAAVGGIALILLALLCFIQRRRKIRKSKDPRRLSGRHLDASSSFNDSSPNLARPKLDSDVSMANHHYKMEGSGLKPNVMKPIARTVNIPKNLEIPRDNLKFVGEVLGKGNFGRVEKALLLEDGKETVVAVKMIKGGGSFADEKELFDELEILASLHPHPHPNIVNLVGGSIFDDGPLFVAVDYCSNGNLLKYLQKNQTRSSRPKAEYVNILPKAPKPLIEYHWKLNKALEICNGMAHLDKHKVIHRDVAARNVLLDDNWVAKISDFGMARDIYVQHIYRKDTEGFLPVRWMAIESLESFIYTSQSDVWSFGILMWEIIADGRVPYNNILDHSQLLNHIKSGRIMKRPKNCPKDYYSIMEKCWATNPSSRPNFDNLAREIQIMYDSELRKEEALPQRIFRKFSNKRKRTKSEDDGDGTSHDADLAKGKSRLQKSLPSTPANKIEELEEEQQLFSGEGCSPGSNAMSMRVLETSREDETPEEDHGNKGCESPGSEASPDSPNVRDNESSTEVEMNKKGSNDMDTSGYSSDSNYETLPAYSRNRSGSFSEEKTNESEGKVSGDERFSLGKENEGMDDDGWDDSHVGSVGDRLEHDYNTSESRGSEDNHEKLSSLSTDEKAGFSDPLGAHTSGDALSVNNDQKVH